jgi:hypothetical protein
MSDDQNDLNIGECPSIYWEKFFKRFSEIEALPIKDWRVVHLLSYFSKRYLDHYGTKFSFRFNANSPSKSYEVFQIRKLGQMISSDPEILKDYIDWFFEHKIILKKKRITSLAFVTDLNITNEYKFKKLAMDKTQNVDRTTALPASFLDMASRLKVDCKTYGDLAFIKRMADTGSADNNDKTLLIWIQQSGFDLSMLEKVK